MENKKYKFLCPGLRYISRPLTYRLCNYEIHPSMGCCDKCLGWPIDKIHRKHIVEIYEKNQKLSTQPSCPLEKLKLHSEYENARMTTHFSTVQNVISKTLQDAFAKGDIQIIERILHPVASQYGDVDVETSIDADASF